MRCDWCIARFGLTDKTGNEWSSVGGYTLRQGQKVKGHDAWHKQHAIMGPPANPLEKAAQQTIPQVVAAQDEGMSKAMAVLFQHIYW